MSEADLEALLTAEHGRLNVWVQQSKVQHPHCGLGVIAARPFRKGVVIVCYCESLVYCGLGTTTVTTESYGEWIFHAPVSELRNWDNHVGFDMTFDGEWHHLYMAHATLFATRFVNYPPYLADSR